MHLFIHQKNNLSSLKEIPFKLEKDIQNLFEQNLESILQLQVVKSEFTIKNYRIDTLAFDTESNSFVIIEYKRSQNYSVIDQGVSYLNLMLEYKADFIVEYNENMKGDLKRSDVDWSQTRIVFVSPSFTDYQKQSSNFKDLAIELWEVKQFENDIIIVNPIKKSKSAPSIKQVQPNENSELSKITKELKVYTEEEHLMDKSDAVKELYETYKMALMQLIPEVEVEAKKLYIAFKKGKNIADVVVLKNSLKFFINMKSGELDDPKGMLRDVSGIGHWGNGDYEVVVDDTKNLEYLMSLIKQAIV
jgi:predicted transport protein